MRAALIMVRHLLPPLKVRGGARGRYEGPTQGSAPTQKSANLLWVPPLRSGRQTFRVMALSLLVLCFSAPALAHSPMNRFWGEVPVDMDLSGDILIVKTLTVPKGVTLTIEPGTIVRFEPSASNSIVVSGRLVAVGTKDKPIQFIPKDGKGFWRGIEFTQGGKGNIENCVFLHAKKKIIGAGRGVILKGVKFE